MSVTNRELKVDTGSLRITTAHYGWVFGLLRSAMDDRTFTPDPSRSDGTPHVSHGQIFSRLSRSVTVFYG